MALQLQTRVRPYIGHPSPPEWSVVDEAPRIKRDWRKLMRDAEPHQGEPEYRVIEAAP